MNNRVGPDPAGWLEANARDRPPVFLEESVPEDVLLALDKAGMASRTPGGIVVFHSPADDPESVRKTLFWSIIQKTAEKYAPAVVERHSALRLYVGQTNPMSEVRLRHAGLSRWRQEILPGVILRLEHGCSFRCTSTSFETKRASTAF